MDRECTRLYQSEWTYKNIYENKDLILLQVLKAHVTSTGSKYTSDLYDGSSMRAEEEFLHISRESSDGNF